MKKKKIDSHRHIRGIQMTYLYIVWKKYAKKRRIATEKKKNNDNQQIESEYVIEGDGKKYNKNHFISCL